MKNIESIFLVLIGIMVGNSLLNAQIKALSKTTALVPDFQVNDNAGNTIQNNSAIAADKNGNFIAVWEDQRDEFNFNLDLGYNKGSGGDIYLQKLDANGNLIGTNIKVNDDDTNMGQHLPAIAASGKGTFVVVWLDGREDVIDDDIFHIYAQRFSESGAPLGGNFKVNEEETNRDIYEYFSPVVAADVSGNFVVAWEEMQNDTLKIFAQRFSDDGSPKGSNFVVNNFQNSEDNRSPQITMNSTGEFVVTWVGSYTDDRNSDVYAQWFLADGTPQGSSVKVDINREDDYIDFPKIGMDEKGNILIAWKDARNGYHDQAIYGQWFALNGSRLGNNFRINEDQSTLDSYSDINALAVAPNGSFCAVWYNPQTTRLSARRFSSDSTAKGNNFSISPDPGISRPANQPAMTINADGQVMVTWTDESDYSEVSYNNYFTDIFAQRIENDSTLLAKPIELNNDTGSGLQQNPAIAIDAEGTFTIAWEDPRNDISDIYMRRYMHDGAMLDGQIRVNNDVYGQSNKTPDVAIDSSGQIMIVWQDERGSIPQIYGQFYSPTGSVIDSNFIINDDVIGAQHSYKPQVASFAENMFIVTWQVSFYDIAAQIYSSESGRIGSTFYVEDTPGDWQMRNDPVVAANDSGQFVIAWEQAGKILAQRFESDGQRLGNNVIVSESWGIKPSLAFKKDGVLNIIFVSDQITGQRFGPNGTAVGSNYTISDSPAQSTFYQNTNIAVDESGKFIVSWEMVNVDNFTTQIFAQRLSEAGTYLGEKIKLINSESENTIQHDLLVLNNRIFTTWIDNHYVGTCWDVFANVLDFDNPDVTAITDNSKTISNFELYQNYPNPFNPSTTINYQIPMRSEVELSIYNALGQKLTTLVSEIQTAGFYQVNWDSNTLASGVYFYKLKTEYFEKTKRMLLLK